MIDRHGIHLDQENNRAIIDWPTPTSTSEIMVRVRMRVGKKTQEMGHSTSNPVVRIVKVEQRREEMEPTTTNADFRMTWVDERTQVMDPATTNVYVKTERVDKRTQEMNLTCRNPAVETAREDTITQDRPTSADVRKATVNKRHDMDSTATKAAVRKVRVKRRTQEIDPMTTSPAVGMERVDMITQGSEPTATNPSTTDPFTTDRTVGTERVETITQEMDPATVIATKAVARKVRLRKRKQVDPTTIDAIVRGARVDRKTEEMDPTTTNAAVRTALGVEDIASRWVLIGKLGRPTLRVTDVQHNPLLKNRISNPARSIGPAPAPATPAPKVRRKQGLDQQGRRANSSHAPKKTIPWYERTLFLKFSEECPLQQNEVRNIFTRLYGNCVEEVRMEKALPCQKALYALLTLRHEFTMTIILGQQSTIKLTICGKPFWIRKYVFNPKAVVKFADHQST